MNFFFRVLKKYEKVILYLFFGALTTLVNFAVYFPLYNLLGFSATFSNIIAWSVAVCFAFFTNKPFVFKSYDWSVSVVADEAIKFVGCRIGSGLFETAIVWLFVDIISWNGNLVKIIVSIIVVLLNYVSSKFVVFKRNV